MEKPQRNDQQEWTHEKLQGLLGINNEDRYVADHAFENTLDEINAALAAERQRREQVESQLSGLRMFHKWATAELESQAKALLPAQAAIEEHNRSNPAFRGCWKIKFDLSLLHQHDAEVREKGYTQGYKYAKAEQSLEMMDHDAEVRKPLVELLRKSRTRLSAFKCFMESGESLNEHDKSRLRELFSDIDAALAQYKEKEACQGTPEQPSSDHVSCTP